MPILTRTRVKYCGITRAEDARQAGELGVDAVGLVFHDISPRHVDVEQARTVVAALPPFVTVVGLFVDAEPARIEQVLAGVRIDVLQFHGNETAAQCARFHRPYIKALRMKPETDAREQCSQFPDAQAILLDSYQPGTAGGTGQTFDWSRIPKSFPKPLILAGGLTAENVAQAIEQVAPYAVDVSGGIERSKGIKDAQKMHAFMQEVMRVGTR